MPFDPCREWLGIDASDLKDPHRVLAIPPTVTDGDEIARLAEERLAQLTQIAPGPFAKAHAALLTRVAEARDTLLATATWATVDETPSEEPDSILPPPMPVGASAPVGVPLYFNPPMPECDHPPAHHTEPEPETDGDDATPIPFASRAPQVPPIGCSEATTGGGGLGLFAIFLAVAIAGGYYAYKRIGIDRDVWDVALNAVVEPLDDLPEPPQAIPTTTPDGNEPPVDVPDPQIEVAHPTSAPQPPSPPLPPPPPLPPLPPAEPDPETKRRMDEERARAAAFVNDAIREAFDALKREDFDKADHAIEAASQYAGDDVDAVTRVERWRLLAAYARGYADFRTRAFQAASAGRDYEIDGRLIVVIEVSPTNFTYRLAGRNHTVARATMSPVLEVGVVEAWFAGGGNAANHFYLGARWLCKEPPNPKRARTAWQKAAEAGEDASPLMALLDDPITPKPDAP